MKLKKWLLGLITFAAMAVLCAVCAGAETYGDYEYSVLDDGTVEITDYNGSVEKVDIPAKIDGKSVTSIGDWAFSYCKSLTSITIPDSVTSIDMWAFSYCTSLTSITIPDSVTSIDHCVFEGCTNLKSITIPNSVTSIDSYAFKECTSLASVTIPDSVTSIEASAFEGCTNLTAINVTTGNQNYVSVSGVLYNKDKTTVIRYPAGKKDKNYSITDGVTSIGWSAFLGCANLTNITIPNSVTSIGGRAFEGCASLINITIPDSVTSIDCSAFNDCISLTAINVTTGNQNYVSVNGVLYNKDKTTLIRYPAGKKEKTYEIIDSVTRVESYAFDGCTSLINITIPDSVIYIYFCAFGGCTSLKSITIPNSVTHIPSDAFSGCTSLTAINVATGGQRYFSVNGVLYAKNPYNETLTSLICYPEGKKDKHYKILDSTTNIGYAFENCTNLTSVTIPNSVTSIGYFTLGYYDNGYKKIENFKIYCYSGTAGEQYAMENGFDYVLLDKLPTLSKVTGAKLTGRAADALRINWTKNANADGYIVEMYQNSNWSRVAKITNNSTTTFRKAGLKASTVYKFRVKAYKMYGSTAVYSEYSSTVTARTNPSVMTGAKLTGRAADALRINWTKNASADGYIVEMYQGNKWVRVGKITNNSTTTFRKAGLKASSVYKFRVRAYKMSGKTALYGNYSATVTARTNPSIMKGVKIGGKAKDALRVNWTKNSSAQGYIVEMYKGGKWIRVAKITNGNTTTFRKAGLAKNTAYKFRVKAYYMSGKTALYGNYGSVSGKTAAK